MTLSGLFKNLGSVIVKGCKLIKKEILNASFTNVAKAGVFIGSTVITIAGTIKHFFNRRKVYSSDTEQATNTKKKTSNDKHENALYRGLSYNFADLNKQDELEPEMDDVVKQLRKGVSKKYKKNAKKKMGKMSFKEYEQEVLKKHRKKKMNEPTVYAPLLHAQLEEFKKDMEAVNYQRSLERGVRNNYQLVEVLHNGVLWDEDDLCFDD